MHMKLNNYLTGLLLMATIACMPGGGNNRNSQSKSREIWEYRTERYLDWISTDADLRLREAQEAYDEACKKQSAADSVSAKKTIRQYIQRPVLGQDTLSAFIVQASFLARTQDIGLS